MPPKISEKYAVVYLMSDITGFQEKVIVAPVSYILNNMVTYLPPLTEDDRELFNSFLRKASPPPPPESWEKYPCVVLDSFAGLTGATNKAKKIKQDPHLLKTLLTQAMTTKIPNLATTESTVEINAQMEFNEFVNNLPPVQSLSSINSVQDCTPNDKSIIINGTDDPEHIITLSDDISETTLFNGLIKNSVNPQIPILNGRIDDMQLMEIQNINNVLLEVSSKVDLMEAKSNSQSNAILAALKRVEEGQKSIKDAMKVNAKNNKIALAELSVKIEELGVFVTERRPLKENENIISLSKLIETHEVDLPLKDRDCFVAFEEALNDNNKSMSSDLHKHFLSTISSSVDIKDTISKIFKIFFKREILMQTVAQTSKEGKIQFNKTKFYSVLKEALINIFAIDFKEDVVLKAIGTVISYSKDWNGHRAERGAKRLRVDTNSDEKENSVDKPNEEVC